MNKQNNKLDLGEIFIIIGVIVLLFSWLFPNPPKPLPEGFIAEDFGKYDPNR